MFTAQICLVTCTLSSSAGVSVSTKEALRKHTAPVHHMPFLCPDALTTCSTKQFFTDPALLYCSVLIVIVNVSFIILVGVFLLTAWRESSRASTDQSQSSQSQPDTDTGAVQENGVKRTHRRGLHDRGQHATAAPAAPSTLNSTCPDGQVHIAMEEGAKVNKQTAQAALLWVWTQRGLEADPHHGAP